MRYIAFHSLIVVFLTALTQIGGLAWIIACSSRRRIIGFVVSYAVLLLATMWFAPHFGRVGLSCRDNGPLQVQSWVYCALNRNYVSATMAKVLTRTGEEMARRHPGTVTLVLDANFPFFDGFPLLPHLSHDDGEKADLAFYYSDETGYLPGATRSPFGYFAFEQGPTDCPAAWPSLRWDFDFLQPLWHAYEVDENRTRTVLQILSKDDRVAKIFVEPHMAARLNVTNSKIRFQGCRAARHDDHIHVQL